jgi:hypothetical protein
MFVHESSGIITYDPWRGDMKTRTTNWCIVTVDKEITRYYREWLRFEQHIHLQPPSWDAHISVVRGERLRSDKAQLWKKYHGKRVNFRYEHVGAYRTETSGRQEKQDDRGLFYFVEVNSPELLEIRREMGLPSHWNHHLTFGRTYEYEARRPKR